MDKMRNNNRSRDMDFNKSAAKYDSVGGKLSRRFYRLLVAQVAQAELSPGANVLDVGCGTGTILRMIADACDINGFGIDMSENMVAEAKRKCPNMDIQISRCEATPFADGTFDAVTACMAYHHFSDKAGFAKEAARILKPGGCLYIADPRFPGAIRKIMNAACRLLRVAGEFSTPGQITAAFAAHGFEAGGHAKDGYAQVVMLKLL